MVGTPVKVGLVENDLDYQNTIRDALEGMPEIGSVVAWESAETFWRWTSNCPA